jgi:histidinol-phosphate aminotransferase
MKDLVNPNVLNLIPYKPGKPVEELRREYRLERIVKLASNENPFPVPQNVVDAVSREISHFNFYPESDSYYLRHRIAEYNGIDAENVTVGAGSVELIRMIVGTFLRPGETVLASQKTFLMYRISAMEIGGKSSFIEVPMGKDYMCDMDAFYDLVDDKTKIIFIANPNNPTGTMVPRQVMMDFIARVPDSKIIVLDNAYQEYVQHPENYPDAVEEALNRKNLIVLRTFSKIYALAGLRIGYAIANDEVLAYLNRLKPPFNVTRAAQAAALASLENEDFKRRSASLNVKNKAKLYRQLKEMGMDVLPSEANFLCFFPGVDTVELNQRLLKEGVIIRPLHAFGVPEGIRVTVGIEEDNDFFIEKLGKVLAEM